MLPQDFEGYQGAAIPSGPIDRGTVWVISGGIARRPSIDSREFNDVTLTLYIAAPRSAEQA
jgi:hypothetical protein